MNVNDLLAEDASWIRRSVFGDPDVYEAERRAVFQRCWLYVAHESQIPDPGDYVASYMGEEPVIVTRQTDGSIGVLVNSCSHRGTPVCRTERGTARTFTCPYHGWQFGNDGRLLGVPHLDAYAGTLVKAEWGLHKAAHVDSCFGLVFATFAEDAEPLLEALGDDFVGYLGTVFDRFDEQVRVVAGVQRWRLATNWKIPPENQSPDIYHVDPSHQAAFSLMGSSADSLTHGVQITTARGHVLGTRYLPEDAPRDERLPGFGLAMAPEAGPWLQAQQDAAERRLGPVRARLSPIVMTAFPNFSVVPTNFAIRVAHPRGPSETEIWSWCFVPPGAPDGVAREILASYQTTLGPSGLVEAEDGENWVSMTRGALTARTDPRPLHLGMGVGTEYTDADLPGLLGPYWSEHSQRGFYRTWRRWMKDAG